MKSIDELLRRGGGYELQLDRGFPNGFWHAEDADGACDVILGCLRDLGLPPATISESFVRSLAERYRDEADEDAARRKQIGDVVAAVNDALERASSPYRLYGFAEDVSGWESDEPVIMLLTESERARLLAKGIARAAR